MAQRSGRTPQELKLVRGHGFTAFRERGFFLPFLLPLCPFLLPPRFHPLFPSSFYPSFFHMLFSTTLFTFLLFPLLVFLSYFFFPLYPFLYFPSSFTPTSSILSYLFPPSPFLSPPSTLFFSIFWHCAVVDDSTICSVIWQELASLCGHYQRGPTIFYSNHSPTRCKEK